MRVLWILFVIAACSGGDLKPVPDAATAIDASMIDGPLPPATAPANVTATPGDRVVALAWNPVEGATRYLVGRATSPGGTRSLIADVSGPFGDSAVTNGVTYYYAVAARNGHGQGPWSDEVAATPNEPIPAAPASLAAVAGRTKVTLTWNAAAKANDYRIARAPISGGAYATLTTLTATTFVDTTVTDNTRYYYVVYARSGGGESPPSNEATALPTDTIPAKPGGLATIVGEEVTVTWDAAAAATEYLLWRGTSATGPWGLAARVPGRSGTDRNNSTGTTWYRVSGLGAGGEGEPSDPISATTSTTAALAPGYLRAWPGGDAVTLMWTRQTSSATQFEILQSSVPGGPYTAVATTTRTAHTVVPPGGNAYYVVRTTDKPSAYSNEVNAATSALLPPTPTGIVAIGGSSHATLHWDPVPGASRYIVRVMDVYRTVIAQPRGPSVDVEHTSVGDLYVTAVIGDRESAWSQIVTVTLDPNAPYRPTLHALGGADRVSLTWGALQGATGYRVLRASTHGGPYSVIATTTATSYGDVGANGVAYYRVQPLGAADGAWSKEVVGVRDTTRPPTPEAPSATVGSGWASLTWPAVSGATGYLVSRRVRTWHEPELLASVTGTAFLDAEAISNPAYTVSAVFGERAGGPSAELLVSTSPALAPLPPTKLAARAFDDKVELTWALRSGVTTSHVLRATSPGGPYTDIAQIPVTSPNGVYTDSSVDNDVSYYYVVTAESGGDIASSAEVTATPSATAPAAPVNVIARGGRTAVALQWDGSVRAASYRIYRSTTAGSGYTQIASPTLPRFTDTDVTDGTTYFYRVSAVSSTGSEGASSGELTTTPSAAAPPPPTLLAAASGNGQIYLRWATADGATSYRVWRSDRLDGPFTSYATTSATTYRDTAVADGDSLFYFVTAIGSGESVPSELGCREASTKHLMQVGGVSIDASASAPTVTWNPVAGAGYYEVCSRFGCSRTTRTHLAFENIAAGPVAFHVLACNGPLECGAPSDDVTTTAPEPLGEVKAAVTAGNGEVGVSWPAFAGATSYRIWRADVGAERYTPIATTTELTSRITGLRNGASLDVAVTAVTPSGETAWSFGYPVTPTEKLGPAPSTATLLAGADAVTITHDRVPGVDAYELEIASSYDGAYDDATTGHRFANSLTLPGTGTQYARLRTCNYVANACSPAFGPIAFTADATRPSMPTGLSLQAGNSEISMTWNPVAGATQYRIYRARGYPRPTSFEPIATVTSAPFVDRMIENEIDYVYTVAAINGAGEGAQAQADSNATDLQAPRAPLGVQAQAAGNTITITWQPSPGASGYLLCRSTSAFGPFGTCTFAGGTSSTTDVALSPGTYHYAILAYTAGPRSALSPIASATVN